MIHGKLNNNFGEKISVLISRDFFQNGIPTQGEMARWHSWHTTF